MTEFITILMFSLAVSADGFMVGVAYGIRKIRMPILSMTIIFMISFLAVSTAMFFGHSLTHFLNAATAAQMGAFLLIIMGMYYLFQAKWHKSGNLEAACDIPLVSFNLKCLGIIIQILREPSRADSDSSGEISPREAFLLGAALAVDAFGAGIGLAMNGFSVMLTAASVGLLQFLLIKTGLSISKLMKNDHLQGVSSLLAGIILTSLGVLKLIKMFI